MPMQKPVAGQRNWAPVLNGALDYLDEQGQDALAAVEALGASVPRLGDAMMPASRNPVPTSKVSVKQYYNTFSGWDLTKVWTPTNAFDVADCAWIASQVTPQAGSLGSIQTGPGGGKKPFDYTTIVEGDFFLVSGYHAGGYYEQVQIWIDGERLENWTEYDNSPKTGPIERAATGLWCVELTFAKRGTYEVRVAGNLLSADGGLFGTNADCELFHPGKRPLTAAVISDSFHDTTIYTSLTLSVAMAAATGWRFWNCSEGGTGMANPGTSGQDHSYKSVAVLDKVAAIPGGPDLIVINGTVNDLEYTEAQAQAAFQQTLDAIVTRFGDVPVYWVGCEPQSYFENIYGVPVIVAREEALRTVADAHPSVVGYSLPAKEKWLTGTGNVASPNGTGNQDFMICTDTIHLSAYGTDAYGLLPVRQMRSAPSRVEIPS